MKPNLMGLLVVCGVSSALLIGTNAPALAEPLESAEGQKVMTAIVRTLDRETLAAGGVLAADSYLANLGEDVEWMSCGASTYGIGDGLLGSGCSDGTVVTEDSMGIAHKTLPLGTQVQIIYNGTVVNAVVHDRGPFVAGRDIDLQPAVARALGFDGVGQLQYRVLV